MRTALACAEPPDRDPKPSTALAVTVSARVVCWPLTVAATSHTTTITHWRDLSAWSSTR